MAADFILLKVKEAAPSLIPVPVGHCAPCVIAPGVTWGAPLFLASEGELSGKYSDGCMNLGKNK